MQLVGCLLKRPELFASATLKTGLTLDEGLTPSDLVTPAGQALYSRLYDMLADGEEVSLARFLASLAEAGELQLANLATQAAVEIDQMTQVTQASQKNSQDKQNRPDGDSQNSTGSSGKKGNAETIDIADIEDHLRVKLIRAAEVILDHHRTSEYLHTRTAAVQQSEAPNDALKQVFEFHKANPSPLKIMRQD